MPVLVPASTWHVPDGYVVPAAVVWEGNLSDGDLLTVSITSSQAAAGSTSPDYDVVLFTIPPTTGVNIVSPTWSGSPVSGTHQILAAGAYGVSLEVGGGHTGDPGGTVFGFQLGVVYATAGFNPPDAALTLQLGNTLAPFGWSVSSVFHSWTGSGSLQLEQGVTAISWTITATPPQVGSSGGTPNYFFTDAFATPITAYGAERSTRVSFSPQLMRLPSAVRQVDFFLPNGLVLDITQLVPSAGVPPS